ncbi:hypothetical protein [Sphingomonas bacterium]|uniref:hypothetical protein n=1 Tax=Sphingomonas bacterium TaxID=1895847 RepID=UPI0015767C96|nr:hypothetical protein [Sphingomonas bacterium]
MRVLRFLRYCLLGCVVAVLAVQAPALITRLAGGDVQQWKWFSVVWGALALIVAMLFAALISIWHVGIALTHRWQKTHG